MQRGGFGLAQVAGHGFMQLTQSKPYAHKITAQVGLWLSLTASDGAASTWDKTFGEK